MPDWGRIAVAAGAASAGTALGYLAERALFRPRLRTVQPAPELGSVRGEPRTVRGPDDVRVHVEVHGPSDPVPAVVLVHGFGLATAIWHEQVLALRDRYRLIAYDQPGHGRSSAPRSGAYSLDLLGDTLAAVIDQATDPAGGRLVVVGHSMGGMSALACARRHPQLFAERVGGLLLLSTTAKSGAEDVAMGVGIQLLARIQGGVERAAGLLGSRVRHLARVYRASSDLSFALTRAVGLVSGADPRYVDLTEQLILDADLDTLRALTPVLLTMDEDRTLADLDVPTVIVVGAEDKITPAAHARHMASVNEDVEVVELPGIGHMTPLEAKDTVNALIVGLARPERPASVA